MEKKKEKIAKSIGCPYCDSSNTKAKLQYKQHSVITSYLDGESKEQIYKKDYNCHCNICNKDYVVNYGYDKHTVFNKPYPITCSADVKMLAMFKSDSSRDYKILETKVGNSKIYFITYEDDEYPIFLNEKDVNKYVNDFKLTDALLFCTWMNRYR